MRIIQIMINIFLNLQNWSGRQSKMLIKISDVCNST